MKTLKQIERLRKMHQLIKIGNTGTPSEFAEKIAISESQLYNLLDDMKLQGFPVIYNKKTKTYEYNSYCEVEIIYSVQLLTQNEKIYIAGGSLLMSSLFIA